MVNKEKRRQRYLKDALPVRLGGLAATLGRISSTARTSGSPAVMTDLLDEARYMIEWTAAEAEPDIAAELVQIQRLLTLWLKLWPATANPNLRALLVVQAKGWSDRALDFSGLARDRSR